LITAIALPLSILPTFAVQNLLGYTLNNMTWRWRWRWVIVDDTVVEVENMERHMEWAKSPARQLLILLRKSGVS